MENGVVLPRKEEEEDDEDAEQDADLAESIAKKRVAYPAA